MLNEESEPRPIPQPEAERIAEILSVTLGEEFAGYSVRVDAGERGRVWVALSGASGDEDAERVTSERLAERLSQIGLEERDIEYRISSGASGNDLVLVCEFFTRTAGEKG